MRPWPHSNHCHIFYTFVGSHTMTQLRPKTVTPSDFFVKCGIKNAFSSLSSLPSLGAPPHTSPPTSICLHKEVPARQPAKAQKPPREMILWMNPGHKHLTAIKKRLIHCWKNETRAVTIVDSIAPWGVPESIDECFDLPPLQTQIKDFATEIRKRNLSLSFSFCFIGGGS